MALAGGTGALLLLATALLPHDWLGAHEAIAVPGDGQPVVVGAEGNPFLAWDGTYHRYPDWETFLACSGWHPGVALRSARLPNDAATTDLPSVLEHPWLTGHTLVRSEGDSLVTYAIVGCVKSPVPEDSPAMQSRPGSAQVVADSILHMLPTGASLVTPLRPAGTVIRLAGRRDMRWILFGGGALAVPSARVLASHCRSTIVEIDSTEFAAYAVVGGLRASRTPCDSFRNRR